MTTRLAGAVDIGGTKIMVGIVDEEGRTLVKKTFPTITGEDGALKSLDGMIEAIKEQCDSIGKDISFLSGVGIVCAGPVDAVSGSVENPYTLPGWEGFPIVDLLRKRTGLYTRLENDANGVLKGEVWLRGLSDRRVVMITFGTGLGVAVYINGGLFKCAGRFHPEMGHVIVDCDGPECYCGHKGCFESLCSGSSINRLAKEEGFDGFGEAFRLSKNGNGVAKAFVQKTERRLRNGVWNLMSVFKPDTLIIGGGFGDAFYDFIESTVYEDLLGLDDLIDPFRVYKALEQGASALAGAASIVFN